MPSTRRSLALTPGKSHDVDRHALERGLRGLVDRLADVFRAVGDEHDTAPAAERQGTRQTQRRVDVGERGIDVAAPSAERRRRVAEEIAGGPGAVARTGLAPKATMAARRVAGRGGQGVPQPAVGRIPRLGADAVRVIDDEDRAARRRSRGNQRLGQPDRQQRDDGEPPQRAPPAAAGRGESPSQMPVAAKSGTQHQQPQRIRTRPDEGRHVAPLGHSALRRAPRRAGQSAAIHSAAMTSKATRASSGQRSTRSWRGAVMPDPDAVASADARFGIDAQIRLPRVTGVDDEARRSEIDAGRVSFGDGVDAGAPVSV